MAYCTVGDVRSYLAGGNVMLPTVDDALLTRLIQAAQAWIESPDGAGVRFEAVSMTRYYDPTRDVRGRLLRLDYPCLTITTLTNGNGETIAASEYITEPRNVSPFYGIRLKGISPVVWQYSGHPDNSISVAGTWGLYTSAPADIVQACIRLAAWLYRQKDTSADVDRPIMTGTGAVIMPSAVPSDVTRAVRAYRERIT